MKSRFHPWMLGLVVIAATGVALLLLRGKGGEPDGAQASRAPAAPEAEVLEVAPVAGHGRIVSASWRTDNEAGERPHEDDAAASLFRDVDLSSVGEEAERRKSFEESLGETAKDLQGLGVYVAPEKPADGEQTTDE